MVAGKELLQKHAETPQDQLAILPWKLQMSESFTQNGRESALFLLEGEGGVCVRTLLIFVHTAEMGNEVAVTV